jgi:hypothetical protein
MGCSSCSKEGGCESEKGPQRIAIDDAMRSIYPHGVWGQPDDEARFLAGVSSPEAMRLARALSVATRAPTFYRAGGPDDLCDFVYVLCVGREPALVDVRDGLAEIEGDRIRERYLRVHLSSVARVAAVQEVAMELDRVGDDWLLREIPEPGVYDAKLLKRMRAVVDLLEASDLEHLDFGMVDKPAPDTDGSEYVARFGVEPTLCNFLFYAQPSRVTATTVLSGDETAVATDKQRERRVAP